ncbi:type II toxin-antitoxin system RelE/ParE family toxin [Sphingobacterium hungaricum]
MNYQISKAAILDIQKIWDYTYEMWSIEQADYYLNLIVNEIEYLALNPLSGKNYSDILEGYFRSKVKMHYIFYRISTSENMIEVVRVLHQRMDVISRLNE